MRAPRHLARQQSGDDHRAARQAAASRHGHAEQFARGQRHGVLALFPGQGAHDQRLAQQRLDGSARQAWADDGYQHACGADDVDGGELHLARAQLDHPMQTRLRIAFE